MILKRHYVDDFNPHSPRGERPTCALEPRPRKNFNPHSPRGERPARCLSSCCSTVISIHTPREGSDLLVKPALRSSFDFNPHSPRGERRYSAQHSYDHSPFQSTLPARGATLRRRCTTQAVKFQSTLPARGATPKGRLLGTLRRFQSTLPARGATQPARWNPGREKISIHTPREGSDPIVIASFAVT